MTSHCLESDCATVWVKIPAQEEKTKERIKAGAVSVSANLDFPSHEWRLNGTRINNTNPLNFDNIMDWRIEHPGNYCQVNIDNFVYQNVLYNVDFEIPTGQDRAGIQGLSVPRMQAKRLIYGRNLNSGHTTGNSLVLYYAQETDNNIACNLKLLDPRDYGGQSSGWDDPYTTLVIHSGETEKATLFLIHVSGNISELEAYARFPRNI